MLNEIVLGWAEGIVSAIPDGAMQVQKFIGINEQDYVVEIYYFSSLRFHVRCPLTSQYFRRIRCHAASAAVCGEQMDEFVTFRGDVSAHLGVKSALHLPRLCSRSHIEPHR